MKAAAARRASHKSTRSHAKTERFYCRVATRRAATVTKPRSAAQSRNRTLQTSGSSRALAAASAQRRARANQGTEDSQGGEGLGGLMAAPVPQPPREPVKCARPGCRNTFTPRNGKRYCSRTCQGRCHAYRFALSGR